MQDSQPNTSKQLNVTKGTEDRWKWFYDWVDEYIPYRLQRRCRELWIFPLRVREYLSAVFSYVIFLWDTHHDWDSGYLFKLLRFKLDRMRKHFRTHAIIVDSEKVACQIDEAIKIIDRILEDDYCRAEREVHEAKWGASCHSRDCGHWSLADAKPCSYISHRHGVLSPEDDKLERAEMWAIFELEGKDMERDMDDLFNLLRAHIREWWD